MTLPKYDTINLADKLHRLAMQKSSNQLRDALIREHPRIIRALTTNKGAK